MIENLQLKPGDRIVVPKSLFGLIQHHAIYLGKNLNGQHLIIENRIGGGVIICTTEEFFASVSKITKVERFIGNNYQRRVAVQKALGKLGQPYHLIDYNCQHFANEIQYNLIKSDQVDGLFEGLKVAAGVALVIGFIKLFND